MNVDLLCLYKYVNRYLVRIEWVNNSESIPIKLCHGYAYYIDYSQSFASPDDHWSMLRFRHSSFMGVLSCRGYKFWEKDGFCQRNFAYSILLSEII